MNKDWLLFILVFIIVIGAGIGVYFFLNDNWTKDAKTNEVVFDPTPSHLEDAFIEVPAIRTHKKEGSQPSLGYTYRITYPQIALVGHPNHAKEANAIIDTFIADILRKFQDEIGTDTPRTKDSLTSDLTISANATFLSPVIIAIRFDTAEYIAGSAHPNNRTYTLHYDIEDRVIMQTPDIFANYDEALSLFSEYSRNTLRERFSDLNEDDWNTMVLSGTAPISENFLAIALTRKGVLIIFDPYQVAPYARGTQEVLVPIDSLRPTLSPRVLEAIRLSAENFVEATPESGVQDGE